MSEAKINGKSKQLRNKRNINFKHIVYTLIITIIIRWCVFLFVCDLCLFICLFLCMYVCMYVYNRCMYVCSVFRSFCMHIRPTGESGCNHLVYLHLSIVAYHDIFSQTTGGAVCHTASNLCIFF